MIQKKKRHDLHVIEKKRNNTFDKQKTNKRDHPWPLVKKIKMKRQSENAKVKRHITSWKQKTPSRCEKKKRKMIFFFLREIIKKKRHSNNAVTKKNAIIRACLMKKKEKKTPPFVPEQEIMLPYLVKKNHRHTL